MDFEKYLKRNGYKEKAVECVRPHCITVSEFVLRHPKGKYILVCQDATIVVYNGCYVDLKGNADDIVLYYYKKEGD